MKLNRYVAALCAALCLVASAYGATLLPNGKQTFLDANGKPLSGGKVYHYTPGTSVLKNTFQDSAQTVLNANPVTLDAAGRAVIFGSGTYRQVVRDSAGNTIWDQLTSDTSVSGAASWAGTSGGSANAQTVTASNFTGADGQSIGFRAGFTNTGALTLNPNGSGAINVVNDLPSGPASLTGGEVVAGNIVTVVYSSASGSFHTSVAGGSVPTGTIMDYAGGTAPTGYLLAYGQAVSRTTYSKLFGVIGTTYGAGDGSTTFNVPDLRGTVTAGVDNMGGAAASRLTTATMGSIALGGRGGAESFTLSVANLPTHTPTGTFTGAALAAISFTIPINPSAVNQGGGSPGSVVDPAGGGSYSTNSQSPGTPAGTITMNPIGSSTPKAQVPPTIQLNRIIKTERRVLEAGVFA